MHKVWVLVFIIALNSGCAALHHIQLSDINNRGEFTLVPFEVKVSETGVDIGSIKDIARSNGGRGNQQAGNVAEAIEYFQMGPRTGAPVFTDKYAEKIIFQIHQECPTGKVTGLNSIRETRVYPVISGEIIKITGFCLRPRTNL
jgi:hypothetical protein